MGSAANCFLSEYRRSYPCQILFLTIGVCGILILGWYVCQLGADQMEYGKCFRMAKHN